MRFESRRRGALLALVIFMSLPGLAGVTAGPATPGRETPLVVDTVIEVAVGDELRSQGLRGRLRVVAWDDDERLELEQRSGDPVHARRQGALLHIDPTGNSKVDLLLRVPRRMALHIRSTDLRVEGEELDGEATLDIVEGEVEWVSGSGGLRLRLAEGDVRLRDVDGRVDVLALDGDVEVRGGAAELSIEVVDGDIVLRPSIARRIGAGTLDGDVTFDGVVQTGGEMELSTHDGDVTLALPADQEARFEVATWDGSFASEFPVRASTVTTGEAIRFRVGSSEESPILRLTSFDGDIRILRGGAGVR